MYFYEHSDIDLIKNEFFDLEFIGGDLYSLETLPGFQYLNIGETLRIKYTAKGYLVARTDVSPNW